MWHFTESDYDSRNFKDPTESTVQSHAEELSALEIFGREVMQNAADNLSPSSESAKVRIGFRLHELSSSAKEQFLNAISFDAIEGHFRSTSQDETLRKANIIVPAPEDLQDSTYVLKVLTIEDCGTRGLVGPEHDMEREAYKHAFPDVPHCFLGLCRTIGHTQKSRPAAGGTHGFGKTVLWKSSRIRMVLFYSNLDQPYIEDGHEHYSRFFGLVRLPGHNLDGNVYRGEGYLGNREQKLTRAFYDEAAREYAVGLGIPIRDQTLKGTTIVIVDFDDPDQSDDDERSAKTISGLRNSAERFFWPAIVAGELEVDVGLNASDGSSTTESAQPHLRSDLLPFIKLYGATVAGETDETNNVEFVDVDIPRGPDEQAGCRAQLAIGVRLSGVEDQSDVATRNTAALVRGAGMVVGYWPTPRRGLAAKDYYAIALGGMACRPPKGEIYGQERFEKLLAWAEPVTHDNWTQNAEALKYWRGSRAAVGRVRSAIISTVSKLTTTTVTPEGDAAPLLAGMFPLTSGQTPGPDPRDIGIEITESPNPLSVGSAEHPQYVFTIRITVPQRSRFRARHKPDNWKVVCSYGFLGEGRHRRVVEQVRSRFTNVRVNSGNWQNLACEFDVSSVYQEDVRDSQVIYELKGETQPMDMSMASVAKHDLAVEVYRGYKE